MEVNSMLSQAPKLSPKIIFFIILCLLIGIYLFLVSNKFDDENYFYPNKCDLMVETSKKSVFMMKNLLSDDEMLKSEKFKKIFFIESHQENNRSLTNPRQACSVESAG